MSENDKRDETADDGVALSPYDSDLEEPQEQAEPEPYSLAGAHGYEETTEGMPAAGGAPDGSAPGAPEGGQAAEAPQDPADTQALDASDAPPAEETEEPEFAAEDATADADSWTADTPSTDAVQATAVVEGDGSVVTDDDVTTTWVGGAPSSAPAADAATALTAGAGIAGAAAAGAEAGPYDTAVRRASLLQPREDAAAEEQTRPLSTAAVEARADKYSPAAEDALFEGATYDKVPSRAGSHTWSIILMLLLTPVAWYLLSDAGARLTLPEGNPWETGTVNLAAIGELAAGLVVLSVILLTARGSSVGATVTGVLLTLVGAAFVVAPAAVQDLLDPYLQSLRAYNDFGGNVAHHLVADGSTGRILIAGVALLIIGSVSHGARRKGREEQRIREAIARRRPAA